MPNQTQQALTTNEYQKDVLRTLMDFPDAQTMLNYGALGLSGEAGETTDELKKVLFHNHPLDKVKIIKEIGDVLYYVSIIASAINVSLDEVMQTNIQKRQARYPYGYDPEHSLYRKPGDI